MCEKSKRALKFFSFYLSIPDFPNIILDIERIELDIACGLQDRVVQTYGGLVHMDFTSSANVYTVVDKSLLPPMYLIYNTDTGERWNALALTAQSE